MKKMSQSSTVAERRERRRIAVMKRRWSAVLGRGRGLREAEEGCCVEEEAEQSRRLEEEERRRVEAEEEQRRRWERRSAVV